MTQDKNPYTELERLLAERVAAQYGRGATIANLTRLSGGASRETWSFDVLWNGVPLPLILKRDPIKYEADGTIAIDAKDDLSIGVDRLTEGRLIEAAHAAGVPVPEIAFYLEESSLTSAGFVMQRLEGEVLGRRVLRDECLAGARTKLAFQCGEAAGRLHGVSPSGFRTLERMTVLDQISHYRSQLDAVDHPYPGFEYGLRWLEENAEQAGDNMSIVHGDFRLGNLVVDESGLRGVLDFELAHLGNPISDLGWICVRSWRYGQIDKTVGGFGELEELLDGYEAATGTRVAEEAVKYWEIFGALRWGMMCINMAFSHLSGPHPSLEKAVIGRRSAETEYDLLTLIN